MRGLAVLAAAAASWVFVTGVLPTVRVRIAAAASPRMVGVAALVALAGASLSFGLLGVPAVSVAIGLICSLAVLSAAQRRRARSASVLREAWPDLLAHVRSGISAGETIDDAFLSAVERSDEVPDGLAEEVRREVVFGGGLSAALAQIAERQDDPTTDRVCATLRTASGTGGPRVGQVVGVLGRSVAEELRLRKAHDAALTEHRWTVNVALVAPWALLALSVATNPQAAEAFSTSTGGFVVLAGFVATGVGWVAARRTAQLSEPPRVFR